MSNGYLKECFIYDTNKYGALTILETLKIGNDVYLYEQDNVIYVCIEQLQEKINENILGVLSDNDAEPLIKFLRQNWSYKLFHVVLSRVDKSADENKRLSVAIYIKDASATK